MSIQKMCNFILKLILLGIPVLAFAVDRNVGLGGVATTLMDPVHLASNFLHAACYIIGGAFLFASIIKYFEHRRSPMMVTMSTIVFLLIAGLVLIAIPLFTS